MDIAAISDAMAIFDAVGLTTPSPVPVLPLPVQMAQKLHACTTPDADAWTNDRAHDLIDLQIIRHDLDDEQLPAVRVAALRLFASRRRHAWPPKITARSGWEAPYMRERESVHGEVIETLDAALEWANQLILDTDGS